MRALVAIFALFLIALPLPAQAQDAADDIPALFERVITALESGDTDTAYRSSQILLTHPDFDDLPAIAQAEAYGIAGYAAFYDSGERTAEALAHLDRAVELGVSNPIVYLTRGFVHLSSDDPVSAGRDLMQADRLGSGVLNSMRGVDILPVINELSQSELEDADLVYRQFVDFLMKRWSPDSPFDSDEYVRFHAARIAIGRDDLIRAGELIETLEFASSRLRVQIEREFATFWIEDEAELQAHIREGAQNAMSLYDTLAEDNPGFIEPLALKAQALSQLGRPQDALTELEAVREGVFTGELIEDVGDQMAWLLNDMAEAHQNLGDMDEAIAIMREAASLSEYGFDNVSQRTNLAWMLAVSGNEEAALAQIDDIDLTLTSSFGEGLVLTTRICAQHFLGRNDGLEADLAALEASGMVTSNLRQFAYACLDDRERAAALLIERLEHPKARTEALADLQDYQDIETEYHGPNHAALKAHDAALLARPDVAAAVEAAGRIIAPGVAF